MHFIYIFYAGRIILIRHIYSTPLEGRSMKILSSMKLVRSAKKVGDRCRLSQRTVGVVDKSIRRGLVAEPMALYRHFQWAASLAHPEGPFNFHRMQCDSNL